MVEAKLLHSGRSAGRNLGTNILRYDFFADLSVEELALVQGVKPLDDVLAELSIGIDNENEMNEMLRDIYLSRISEGIPKSDKELADETRDVLLEALEKHKYSV
jgi:hypothetical protein